MNKNTFNISQYLLFALLILVDIIALYSSLEIALYLRHNYFGNYLPDFDEHNRTKYFWIIVISIFMLIWEKIYFSRHDFWGDLKRILKALSFSFLAVFTTITLTKIADDYSRVFIILFFLVSIIVIPLFKRISKKLLFKLNLFTLKVNVLAKGAIEKVIKKEISENWYFGFQNSAKNYDIVIIASKSFSTDELPDIIKQCSDKTKDIYVIPYMDHLDFSHATIMDYSNIRLSAIHIENRLLNSKNTLVKYLFEKVLTLMIFPFALLLHLLISIAIKLDSPGKVIFKQKRLGKDSKPFSCYKYRTMYDDSQKLLDEYLKNHPDETTYYGIYHKYQNDPRITKLGNFLRKTSLDEFPQFYNILQGKMNLVGPRPYMINEKSEIGTLNEEIILKVKPGITGLWQVSGRNSLSFKQRVELDSWYIQNWSLWIDFVILIKTIKVVILKVSAS